MTQPIKQDDPDGTSVARRGAGAHPSFPGERNISANDNDFEGSWSLVPSASAFNSIRSGQQEPIQRHSTEGASPSLYEVVNTSQAAQAGFRSSWRATLVRLAYVAAISAAMFGWLYLLWLALLSSVQGILS